MKKQNYSSLFDLKGKVAVITGAAGSIGREYAIALAQNGVGLALVDINQEELAVLKDELSGYGIRVEVYACDLRIKASIVQTVQQVIDSFERVDILLNHAGLNIRKPALDYIEEDWHKIMDVNAKGAFFMAQQVGKYMVENGSGKIINTASVSSFRGHPNLCIYAMTKGAIAQMTKVLAHEWAPYNVNVNAIAPGYIFTNQTRKYVEDRKIHDSLIAKIPMGRIGRPGDLVGVMMFLSSAASDYITGQTILVDGGRTID